MAIAALIPVVFKLAAGTASQDNAMIAHPGLTCTFAYGSVVAGQCMPGGDEFNAASLDTTKWVAADDWVATLNGTIIPEQGCIRHENAVENGD